MERRQHPPSGSGGGHKHSRFNRERAARSFVRTKTPSGKEILFFGDKSTGLTGSASSNSIVKSSTYLETISTSNQEWTHSCKYGGGDGPRVPLVSPIAVIELPGYSELKVWFVELITHRAPGYLSTLGSADIQVCSAPQQ